MKNYHLTCQHCGTEFDAKRKDAIYCSASCRNMASKQRMEIISPKTTEFKIEYTRKELKQIKKLARKARITPESLIKKKSLLTAPEFLKKQQRIEELEKENIKLTDHLSVYTKEVGQCGMYIKAADEKDIEFFHEEMSEAFPDYSFDEAVTEAISTFNFYKAQCDFFERQFFHNKELYEN